MVSNHVPGMGCIPLTDASYRLRLISDLAAEEIVLPDDENGQDSAAEDGNLDDAQEHPNHVVYLGHALFGGAVGARDFLRHVTTSFLAVRGVLEVFEDFEQHEDNAVRDNTESSSTSHADFGRLYLGSSCKPIAFAELEAAKIQNTAFTCF